MKTPTDCNALTCFLPTDKVVFNRPLSALLCNRGSCMMKIGDCAGCISDCTAALQILPGAFRPLLKRAEAYEISEKCVAIVNAFMCYFMFFLISFTTQNYLNVSLQILQGWGEEGVTVCNLHS